MMKFRYLYRSVKNFLKERYISIDYIDGKKKIGITPKVKSDIRILLSIIVFIAVSVALWYYYNYLAIELDNYTKQTFLKYCIFSFILLVQIWAIYYFLKKFINKLLRKKIDYGH
jgi:hypothetical protein